MHPIVCSLVRSSGPGKLGGPARSIICADKVLISETLQSPDRWPATQYNGPKSCGLWPLLFVAMSWSPSYAEPWLATACRHGSDRQPQGAVADGSQDVCLLHVLPLLRMSLRFVEEIGSSGPQHQVRLALRDVTRIVANQSVSQETRRLLSEARAAPRLTSGTMPNSRSVTPDSST